MSDLIDEGRRLFDAVLDEELRRGRYILVGEPGDPDSGVLEPGPHFGTAISDTTHPRRAWMVKVIDQIARSNERKGHFDE
jgi:hypothetical protein